MSTHDHAVHHQHVSHPLKEGASSDTRPETDDTSVQQFAALFVVEGVPWEAAQALARRILLTGAELRLGRITEAQAEERIDRMAGMVFQAVRAMARAA
jgi:hypothetical protein